MRKRIFFMILLSILLQPALCGAQEAVAQDVEARVEELNDMCPIDFGDDWGVNSFTMVGDRYALVDIKLPSSLSMVLSSFSDESNGNVKRFWVKQLNQYGDLWNDFVDMMVAADRRIVISLHPVGSKTALLTFYPSDFRKE